MSSHQARSPLEIYDANVASDLTAVRLQIGNLDQKVEALDKKIGRNQAQIIELLTQVVGQRPEAG